VKRAIQDLEQIDVIEKAARFSHENGRLSLSHLKNVGCANKEGTLFEVDILSVVAFFEL